MLTLPAVLCINCRIADLLQVVRTEQRHEDGSDPPVWIAATYHVECQACGHKFQLALIPEA